MWAPLLGGRLLPDDTVDFTGTPAGRKVVCPACVAPGEADAFIILLTSTGVEDITMFEPIDVVIVALFMCGPVGYLLSVIFLGS